MFYFGLQKFLKRPYIDIKTVHLCTGAKSHSCYLKAVNGHQKVCKESEKMLGMLLKKITDFKLCASRCPLCFEALSASGSFIGFGVQVHLRYFDRHKKRKENIGDRPFNRVMFSVVMNLLSRSRKKAYSQQKLKYIIKRCMLEST